MIASEIMEREFPTLDPDTPLAEAFRIMREADRQALPVVEEGKRLVGIVSEDDFLRAALPVFADSIGDLGFLPRSYRFHGYARDRLQATTVRALVCSREPVFVEPEERVAEVAHIMLENDVAAVPVVRDGLLVGLVTRTRLVAQIGAAEFESGTQE